MVATLGLATTALVLVCRHDYFSSAADEWADSCPPLAHHELRAATRSLVVAILVLVTVVSVYVGAVGDRRRSPRTTANLRAAEAGGAMQLPPPPMQLLSLLRDAARVTLSSAVSA